MGEEEVGSMGTLFPQRVERSASLDFFSLKNAALLSNNYKKIALEQEVEKRYLYLVIDKRSYGLGI